MVSELTPKARNFARNIDLAWNPGVDHDFDAAECTLGFPFV